MKYIIGNWKANKTWQEVQDWMSTFVSSLEKRADLKDALKQKETALIICPPYHYLASIHEKIAHLDNVYVGSQDVSLFDVGKFTGEVPAQLLASIASYAIIGHSERRGIQVETNEEIETKLSEAKSYGIEPILCVRGKDDPIPDMTKIVAFEPVEAIGTGDNMRAEQVIGVKQQMDLPPDSFFLYGGSVTRENCSEYLESDEIDGLLIGSASLDPEHFLDIASYGNNI
jgi:triosephosphate isomerase